MKKIWSCRRTFLSTLAIAGLLYIMTQKDKDFAVEIVALAAGIGIVNMMEKRKNANPEQ